MSIQNSFIFREPQWGSTPESFIQKCRLVSEIQSFEVENCFLMPFSIWNCAFLMIFDFKALYFWNQSIFLNETFRRASPLRFPENETILDGRGNCLMPATPIFQKHCFFKKSPKNLTNFRKFKFFLHFLLQFYRAFQWYIVCFHILSGLGCTVL